MKGRIVVMYDGEEIGSVLVNYPMTREEICDFAGVHLATTQEEWEGMPENNMYALEDLEFVYE